MSSAALQQHVSDRPRSRTFATTGAAVLAVCVAYVGWSLLAGRSETAPTTESGVELGRIPDRLPTLSVPPETPPIATLTLDDGTAVAPLPVMNAHLEVSAQDDRPEEIAPALQQLSFESTGSTDKPRGAVGAWLTGVIEPVGPNGPTP